MSYYRTYLSSYVADMSAIALSVVRTVGFLLSGYHAFSQSKAMARNLYGMTRYDDNIDITVSEKAAHDAFRDRVNSRFEFDVNYWSWCFYTYIMTYSCCCFKRCCVKMPYCKSRLDKYKKFDIALARLSQEHDI